MKSGPENLHRSRRGNAYAAPAHLRALLILIGARRHLPIHPNPAPFHTPVPGCGHRFPGTILYRDDAAQPGRRNHLGNEAQ